MHSHRRRLTAALTLACGSILTISPAALASAPASKTVAFKVTDTQALADLNIDPINTIDYGSYTWVELDSFNAQKLRVAKIKATPVESPFTLRLGEVSFDPLNDGLPTLPRGWDAQPNQGKDLKIVQFEGPTKAAWLESLAEQGLEVIRYIHPHAYVVYGDTTGRADILAETEGVRWSGDFLPAFRVLPWNRNLGAAMVDFKVLLVASDSRRAVAEFEARGLRIQEVVDLDGKLAMTAIAAPGDSLADLAAIPGVYSIQPVKTDGGLRGELSNQINANNVMANNAAFPGYSAWLAQVGLSGQGVVLANVDGGIDNDHPDLVGQFLPCVGSTCGGSTNDDHGTHTAGIMAAHGQSGVTDGAGFLRALGVAPGAKLIEQVYSPTFTQPGGMLTLMQQSYANGAVLSGNSWGPAGTPQGYDDDTMQVDIGVRDADPNTPGNQQFTFVLSFMNGNGGTSSQGSPDEAKNLFNIGSTKSQTNAGAQILQINDLSANSAHGPALDGRTIPHMVAPGCEVDSSNWPSDYDTKCGTSMASPHVAGGVGLFFEYYRNLPNTSADPSPALVKAAFMAAAQSLTGNLDADGGVLTDRYDSKQGFGRMDLQAVLDPTPNSTRYFDAPVTFQNTGEEWTTTVAPFASGEPVRMMLVWTDAPGHGLGGSTPAWNNDLDLIVEAGGNTYYGNRFNNSTGFSIPGGAPDAINNTEGIFLSPAAAAAGITVTVRATNLTSDGVPGMGSATDQDFSLVIYNGAEEPGFTLAGVPATVELCDGSNASFSVDVGSILGFSDPVSLSLSGLPGGASGSVSTPVSPGSSAAVQINTGGVAQGEYPVTLNAVSGDIERAITFNLAVANGTPSAPSINGPTGGGASLAPVISWGAIDLATGYDFQLSTNAAFTNIVASASGLEEPTFAITDALNQETTYFWRARATNACGDGAYAQASFTTRAQPSILLVDDDDNSPNAFPLYEAIMAQLGADYDVWDTNNSDNEPDAATLNGYQAVIWFTGDEFGGFAGPGSTGEAALADFIDAGGCLLMSAQDYYYDRGVTSFMSNYLGLASATSDVAQTSVTGEGDMFGSLGNLSLSYPFTNYSDRFVVGTMGNLAFTGNNGIAGVYRIHADGNPAVFLGFPIEAVSGVANQAAVVEAFLAACPADADCPGDTDGNNAIDLADLNAVLANFGSAGPAGDVDASGAVDLADLNIILGAFGSTCD